MSGFDNEVLYANNVDFTGTFPVSGQMNINGELLVGSAVAPFIRSYVPIGSTNVTISTGPGTIDFSLSGPPSATNLINHGVVIGQGTSAVIAVSPGNSGTIFQSSGAGSDPAWTTATYPSTAGASGKILISDGTNIVSSTPTYPNAASTSGKVVISDGTNFVTSTPTFPNASASSGKFIRSDGTNWVASTPTLPTSAGTSGKVLQSDGTNYVESTPTYPSTSGSTGKIIRSDGTNNVYTTATFPDTAGSSGNVLTSDGTNWSSSAPAGGGLTVVSPTLTNAQIKALHGTPVEVIAAQGSGKVIVIVRAVGKMTYGGTNVFTAGAGQTISLYYGTTQPAITTLSSTGAIINNNTLVAAASAYNMSDGYQTLSASSGVAIATMENVAINLYNPIVTEIGGNAANNNTMSFSIVYYVITI